MELGRLGVGSVELESLKVRTLQLVRSSRDPARCLQLLRAKVAALFGSGDLRAATCEAKLGEDRWDSASYSRILSPLLMATQDLGSASVPDEACWADLEDKVLAKDSLCDPPVNLAGEKRISQRIKTIDKMVIQRKEEKTGSDLDINTGLKGPAEAEKSEVCADQIKFAEVRSQGSSKVIATERVIEKVTTDDRGEADFTAARGSLMADVRQCKQMALLSPWIKHGLFRLDDEPPDPGILSHLMQFSMYNPHVWLNAEFLQALGKIIEREEYNSDMAAIEDKRIEGPIVADMTVGVSPKRRISGEVQFGENNSSAGLSKQPCEQK